MAAVNEAYEVLTNPGIFLLCTSLYICFFSSPYFLFELPSLSYPSTSVSRLSFQPFRIVFYSNYLLVFSIHFHHQVQTLLNRTQRPLRYRRRSDRSLHPGRRSIPRRASRSSLGRGGMGPGQDVLQFNIDEYYSRFIWKRGEGWEGELAGEMAGKGEGERRRRMEKVMNEYAC
ncbi:hypothetical protein BDQ17DRAFT_830480 [Cyathus striatus]|nr:hypothetical protein BDQ17DRAFT_830480 [Cyathus striatus]